MVFKSAGKWGTPRYVVDYKGKGASLSVIGGLAGGASIDTILADMTRRVVLCGVIRMARGTRAGLAGSITAWAARQSGPANETGSA